MTQLFPRPGKWLPCLRAAARELHGQRMDITLRPGAADKNVDPTRQLRSAAGLMLVACAVVVGGASCRRGEQVGMIVVYEVDADPTQPGAEPSDAHMRALLAVLDRRLNPDWRASGRIRQRDDGRIEVGIFQADLDTMQRIADLLPRPGTLEFRILANDRDHQSLIRRAEAEPDSERLHDDAGDLLAWWVPVHEDARQAFSEGPGAKRIRDIQGKSALEVLVVNDRLNVTSEFMLSAQPDVDARGKPNVQFTLNAQGGRLFGRLTGNHVPDPSGFYRQLGIILDGRLYSAPTIRAAIYDRGVIDGQFTRQETHDLADLLSGGALPVAIRKVEQRIVEAGQEPAP